MEGSDEAPEPWSTAPDRMLGEQDRIGPDGSGLVGRQAAEVIREGHAQESADLCQPLLGRAKLGAEPVGAG